MQVLVVEDDDLSASLLVRTINRCSGFTSQSALNGKDAIEAIRKSEPQFDIIVLDLSLPDVDGLEFIRLLSETTFEGGVVIASGHSRSVLTAAKQLADIHNITVLGVLQKPISQSELRTLLEKTPSKESNSSTTNEVRYDDLAGSQIVPYYQPQVDVHSGAIVRFEALLRLRLADGLVVGPSVLFSRLRNMQDRVSTSLDFSMLVLKDFSNILSELPEFPGVAINFDARVLENYDAMASFMTMVKELRILPWLITIEVVEQSLSPSSARLLETLTRMSMAGFRISLDCYGMGGSNNDLLSRSPFDELKLDYSLIHSELYDQVSQDFVRAAVDTARKHELRVVGKSVETREQLVFAREHGIECVQGFLFERPLPIAKAIGLVRSELETRKTA